ncbi:MAG: hypothetical protein ACTS1X_03560 [Parasphingopyxis sp.]|uniref:hypothetical protein n=1 Tax=Parasphingopyxis sp. TaxID=1920299 RepID=UPI003FA04EAD
MAKKTKRSGRRILGILGALCGLSLSSIAQAGISCSGPVNVILYDPDGRLIIDFGHGYVYLCSLDGNVTYGGTTYTPTDCQRIHATALTALGTGSDLSFYFPGSWTSCSQLFTYPNLPADNWTGMYLVDVP